MSEAAHSFTDGRCCRLSGQRPGTSQPRAQRVLRATPWVCRCATEARTEDIAGDWQSRSVITRHCKVGFGKACCYRSVSPTNSPALGSLPGSMRRTQGVARKARCAMGYVLPGRWPEEKRRNTLGPPEASKPHGQVLAHGALLPLNPSS